jgi:hypothetical protein
MLIEGESRFQCMRRLRHLYEASPHLTEAAFLQRYAEKHRNTLLAEREAIREEFMDFVRDEVFVMLLQRTDPRLYAVATWKMRALAIAEQLEVELHSAPSPEPPFPPPESPPRRPPSTPEERAAGFERYRTRALERIGVGAGDFMAKARLHLQLVREFREELERQDFDPDDIDREVGAFRDWLTQASENEVKTNEAYKIS